MQNFFDSGFGPAPVTTTGAPGTDGGTSQQFGNVLVPDGEFNVSTGAPGTAPHADRAGDPGHGDVAVTDVFGHLNGNAAPPVHGTTATSWEGMESLWGSANPSSTGAGEGTPSNGAQRIGHGE